MSEEPTTYNRVQLSTFINGDQVVLRADTGEELKAVAEGVAKEFEAALEHINTVKQLGIAKGVFTGDSSKKGSADAPPKKRTRDAPPPSSSGDTPPECLHGPMKDLSDKNYKHRWYCAERGKDKACWAKD